MVSKSVITKKKKHIPRRVRQRQIERMKRAVNYIAGLEEKRIAKETKKAKKIRWKHLYE
jgi:hypothetical protein